MRDEYLPLVQSGEKKEYGLAQSGEWQRAVDGEGPWIGNVELQRFLDYILPQVPDSAPFEIRVWWLA